MLPLNLAQIASFLQGGNATTAPLVGALLQQGLQQQNPYNFRGGRVAQIMDNLMAPMQGIGGQFGQINAMNQANAGRSLDRELQFALGQLGAETERYRADRGLDAALGTSQGDLYETMYNAQALRDQAGAGMAGQIGASQNNAIGQYLGGFPAAFASMANAPLAANASRDVAQIGGNADIMSALIPAQLQYALAPAQLGSAERIAGINAGAGQFGDLANAQAQMYAARQGAGANMFGSQAAADAAMFGSQNDLLSSALGSGLGFRGLVDTNATNRYGADRALTGQALGHQLGLQGVQDTNKTNLGIAQDTNRTNLGIAGLQSGAQRFGTLGDVTGARLGLEGTRATADANRFGSQQNALASMFGSGAGLQSVREQEAGRNRRFDKASDLFDLVLGRFSAPPRFGGFRTNFGTGVTV